MPLTHYALIQHRQSGEIYAIQEDEHYATVGVCGPLHHSELPDYLLDEAVDLNWFASLDYGHEDVDWVRDGDETEYGRTMTGETERWYLLTRLNAPAEEIAAGFEAVIECESCAEGGQHGVPAVGHSRNPDWSGYNLCQECIDEYDSRPSINKAE